MFPYLAWSINPNNLRKDSSTSTQSFSSRPSRAKSVVPTLDQVLVTKETIETRYYEPWSPDTFLDFLKSERNQENMFFFEEVEAFRAILSQETDKVPPENLLYLPHDVRKDQKTYIDSLIKTFIKEGAVNQVNISDAQRREITTSPDLNSFLKAQTEIKKLMQQDSWPRFIRKCLTENLSNMTRKKFKLKALFLGVIAAVAIGLFFGLFVPRWYFFLLYFPIQIFLDFFVIYKMNFCPNTAMRGLRGYSSNKNEVIACPIVKGATRKRAKKFLMGTFLLSIFLTLFFFSLTFAIDAGLGQVVYG